MYSLTHSLTHPAYLMPREQKRFHFRIVILTYLLTFDMAHKCDRQTDRQTA